MNLIVVSDIFGQTSALNDLVLQFSELYDETVVVDPYDGQNISFLNEENAYKYFQKQCGPDRLKEKLDKEVVASNSPVDIVGFSVGGTSAWEISEKYILKNVRKVVCFYGSRIREKIEITPLLPTSLVFPSFEKDFEVEPVIQAIEKKQNVEVIRTDYLHGFMNKKSINYSEKGYDFFSKWLMEKAV
jgi:dienelactone hydrolase